MTLNEIKKLWEEFADVPIDNNDAITQDFHHFNKGTSRFDVWSWFDGICPNGIKQDLLASNAQ